MSSLSIEDRLIVAEDKLGGSSVCPGCGAIPAVLRVLMGAVQMVVAVVVTFFSLLAAPCSKSARQVCDRAWRHIIHGLGNIVAGALEAIPLVTCIEIKCIPEYAGKPQGSKWLQYSYAPHDVQNRGIVI